MEKIIYLFTIQYVGSKIILLSFVIIFPMKIDKQKATFV